MALLVGDSLYLVVGLSQAESVKCYQGAIRRKAAR